MFEGVIKQQLTSNNKWHIFLSRYSPIYENYHCEFNYDEHGWINGSSGAVSSALRKKVRIIHPHQGLFYIKVLQVMYPNKHFKFMQLSDYSF